MNINMETSRLLDLENIEVSLSMSNLVASVGEVLEFTLTLKNRETGDPLEGLEGVKLLDLTSESSLTYISTKEVDSGVYLVSLIPRELKIYELYLSVEDITSEVIYTIEIFKGEEFDFSDSNNCEEAIDRLRDLYNSNEQDFTGSSHKTKLVTNSGFYYYDGYYPETKVGAYARWVTLNNFDDEIFDSSTETVTVKRKKIVEFNEHHDVDNTPKFDDGTRPIVVGEQEITFYKCELNDVYGEPIITTTEYDVILYPNEESYCDWINRQMETLKHSLTTPQTGEGDSETILLYNKYPIYSDLTEKDAVYLKYEIVEVSECEKLVIHEVLMEGETYDGYLGLIELPLKINEYRIEAKPFIPIVSLWEEPTLMVTDLAGDTDPNTVYQEELKSKIEECLRNNDHHYQKFLDLITPTNEVRLFKDKYTYIDGGDYYESSTPVYMEWVTTHPKNPKEDKTISECYLRTTKNYDDSWLGFNFPLHVATATFDPMKCSLMEIDTPYEDPSFILTEYDIRDPGISLEEKLKEKIRECRERNIEEQGYFNMRLLLEYKRDKLFDKYEYISGGDITSNAPVYLSWQVDRPTDRAEGVITAKLVFQKTLGYDGSWPGFEFPVIKEELTYTPQACSLMNYDTPYTEPVIERIVHDIEDKGIPYEEKRKEVIEECIENNKKHYLEFINSLSLTHIRGKLFDKYLYSQGGTVNSVEPVYLAWDIDDSGDMVEGVIKATLSYKPTRNYDNSWTGFNFPVVVEELTYTPQVCSLIGYDENYTPPKITRKEFEVKDPNPSPAKPPQEEMDKIRDQKRKECYEKNTKLYHEFVDSLKITPKPKILFDKYLYMDGGDKNSTLPVYTTWSIENSGNHIEGQTIFKKIYQPTDNYDCSWDGFRFPIVEKIIVYTPTNCSLMEWDDDWNSPSIEEEDVEIWDPNDPNVTPPDPEYPCNPDPTDPDPPNVEGEKDACPLRCDLIGLKPGDKGNPDNKIYDKLTGICKCKYNPFK